MTKAVQLSDAGGGGKSSERHEAHPSHTVCSRGPCTIYFVVYCYITSVAMTIIPTIAKTEAIVSGTNFVITSESAFVVSEAVFINGCVRVLFSKAMTAISDYIGRKPIILLSTIMFVIARVVLIHAHSKETVLAVAAMSGVFDVVYPTCQAWLCDLLPAEERAKSFGLLAGLGFGFGFTFGLPIGAVVSQSKGPDAALYMSCGMQFVLLLVVLLLAPEDTYGIKSKEAELLMRQEHTLKPALAAATGAAADAASSDSETAVASPKRGPRFAGAMPEQTKRTRRLPSSWKLFLRQNHPLTALPLFKQAQKNSYDWLTFLITNMAQQILVGNLIAYMQDTFKLNQAEAGIALSGVGLGVALVAPVLGWYKERGLLFRGSMLQIVAYIVLGLSSLGAYSPGKIWLLVISVLLIVCGCVWISAMQSIVVNQYPPDMQGEVTGVCAEVAHFANIIAAPVGLLFAYTLKSDAKIQWRGVFWMFPVLYLLLGNLVQYKTCPEDEQPYWHLIPRELKEKTADDDDDDDDDVDGEGKRGSRADYAATVASSPNPMHVEA